MNFGKEHERIGVGIIAIVTGALLIYLAALGPLWLNIIKYKTAEIVNYQLAGQDIVNMTLLSGLLIVGGVMLLLKKRGAGYVLIMTPLYLIYFCLSYGVGMEWSHPDYSGNSEQYFYYFLIILIAALIILLYSVYIFPKQYKSNFRRKGLTAYTVVYTIFLLAFAMMWLGEVNEVIKTGTSRGYNIAPVAFWTVRFFDLGFSIPLGLLSIYLLWIRPDETFGIQFLFYGFFVTMITAVNAMAFFMYVNNDPTFEAESTIVFIILATIIYTGFYYILRNYKVT